jgi:hypothetical protein
VCGQWERLLLSFPTASLSVGRASEALVQAKLRGLGSEAMSQGPSGQWGAEISHLHALGMGKG